MRQNHLSSAWLGAVSLLALAVATSAHAAQPATPAAPAADSGSGNEIVVTATRREERLLNVPIADTALSTKKLEEKQVTDVVSLSKVVPAMHAQQTLSPLEISVSIRGVTQLLPNADIDPAIGTYVDGVYNAVAAGANAQMIDLERVEVLKGPQGTLFGRNTIGGAISVVTAKPTDTFGGYVQLDGGSYGEFTGTSVLNLPIRPGLLDARLVYQHTQHSGYGTDFTTGTPTNTADQDYFRGSLKFTPSNDWSLLVSGFYDNARGYSAGTRVTNPGFLGLLASPYVNAGGFQDSFNNLPSTYRLTQYGATATITGRLNDAVSIKSITGYSHTSYDTISDADGTPTGIINVNWPVNIDQISEELQLYGNALDNRFKWIAGAYFFTDFGEDSLYEDSVFNGPVVTRQGPNLDNKSYSVFAQASYALTPKLNLTGGVRYVLDDRSNVYDDRFLVLPAGQQVVTSGAYAGCDQFAFKGPGVVPAHLLLADPTGTNASRCQVSLSVQQGYAPWTVSLDYKPNPNAMLYAKVSQGYRAGALPLYGPQPDSVGAFWGAVAPESLLSPEVGGKFDLLDHKLQINASGYFSHYTNVQAEVNSALGYGALINSGTLNIWGGEIEATAHLDKLILEGAFGYTNPEYTRSSFSYGQPAVNIAKINWAVTATYPIETSAGVLTLTGTYSYRSTEQLYTNVLKPPAAYAPGITQPGFGLLDAQASFKLANAPITFTLYGQNLTNQKYFVAASQYGGPNLEVKWPGPPLTFGGSIKYSF